VPFIFSSISGSSCAFYLSSATNILSSPRRELNKDVMTTTGKKIFSTENYHRSRERIRDLGEVFTPEEYVNSMLFMLSKGQENFWRRDDFLFFEPSCGHGNIVIPILTKRLDALYKKAKSSKIKNPELFAIANSINSPFAIDIDIKNINHCRERVFTKFMEFIIQNTSTGSLEKYIDKYFVFFVHLLCAITWHIHENEALSCLSKESEALTNANKTKSGEKWFSKNSHKSIDFDLGWVEYFTSCDSKNLVPIEYKRAYRFLNNAVKGCAKGQSDFPFAKSLIFNHAKKAIRSDSRKSLKVGL